MCCCGEARVQRTWTGGKIRCFLLYVNSWNKNPVFIRMYFFVKIQQRQFLEHILTISLVDWSLPLQCCLLRHVDLQKVFEDYERDSYQSLISTIESQEDKALQVSSLLISFSVNLSIGHFQVVLYASYTSPADTNSTSQVVLKSFLAKIYKRSK